MLVRGRKSSLLALFSPKLCTVLNHTELEGLAMMGLRESSLGIELEIYRSTNQTGGRSVRPQFMTATKIQSFRFCAILYP